MKTNRDRGIVRIDQPEKYNHGWWVRRRRGSKMFSKFFADKKLGGKNKARLAARAYNDDLTEKLPEVARRRPGKGMTAKAKTTSAKRSKAMSPAMRRSADSQMEGRNHRFIQSTTRLPQRRRRFTVAR